MLYQMLSQEEIDTIQSFICRHSGYGGMANDIEWVLRYWSSNKQRLYKMFNNNFVLRKRVSYSPSEDEKNVAMQRAMATDNAIIDFRTKFFSLLNTKAELISERYHLLNLVELKSLVENKYDGINFSIMLPREKKPYKIINGMKVMKALQKISKAYGLDVDYEEFRLAHSRVYNAMIYHGTLCLSIHPIDFMSMSVNNSGWNSCLNWPDGCHCLGAVELMNSKNAVIAYLESDKPYEWEVCGKSYACSNKKWRELFIVDENIISEIKGYPYQNEALAKECLTWLCELAMKFDHTVKYTDDIFEYKDVPFIFDCGDHNEHVNIRFDSGYMYNDFGAIESHYCFINPSLVKSKKLLEYNYTAWNRGPEDNLTDIYIDYSGPAICVYCGEHIGDDCCYEDEFAGRVVCHHCAGLEWCESCETWVDGETYEVDGVTVCECCHENDVGSDYFTDEDHFYDNMIEVRLVKDPNATIKIDDDVVSFYISENTNLDNYLVKGHRGIFEVGVEREYLWEDGVYTFPASAICISDISEETRKTYFRNLPEDFWN